MSCSSLSRAAIVGLFAASIAGLGVCARAQAQTIEVAPPDQPASEAPAVQPPEAPPSSRLYAPPEVPPAPQSEAPPAPPPGASPETVAATPAEARPAPTEAAAFGEAWHYAISLERAFGIDHLSQTESYAGQEDSKATATNFSLFGVPAAGALSAFSFPRGAFDLFVAPDFSVGLGLGLVHGSTSFTEMGASASDQTFTGILAMPRGGYAWHLTPDITLWTRAGVSVVYLKTSASNGYGYESQSTTEHFVAATVELPVVFALAPRVAFTVGPTLDVSFVGHKRYPVVGDGGQPDRDEHITELGVQAGLLIHL